MGGAPQCRNKRPTAFGHPRARVRGRSRRVLAMLGRPEGATIAAIMRVRGFFAGVMQHRSRSWIAGYGAGTLQAWQDRVLTFDDGPWLNHRVMKAR